MKTHNRETSEYIINDVVVTEYDPKIVPGLYEMLIMSGLHIEHGSVLNVNVLELVANVVVVVKSGVPLILDIPWMRPIDDVLDAGLNHVGGRFDSS